MVDIMATTKAAQERRVPPTFEDCILEINEKHGKGYPMILSGPAGRQTGTLHVSPASAAMRANLSRLKSFATDEQFLQDLGHTLFSALLPPRLRSAWSKHRQALAEGSHLRLKLIIQPPEIAALPWELMCDEDGIPVATSTPVVRYLSFPDPPKPLTVRPPLRVLVSIADPRDQVPLSTQVEKKRITAALSDLVDSGLVDLAISERATGIGLLNDLRRGVHIWHFIGHGVFNPLSANGSLAFENESGDTDLIDAKRLRILLEENSVRLAILNACETGRFSLDPLLGIAPALVRAGIPAVVATQFNFPDTSAVEFSSMFYRALADGYPVDACVSEGRKAVITRLGLSQPDWAIPVLYMRAPDGHLFVQERPDPPRPAKPKEVFSFRLPDFSSFRSQDTASLRTLARQLSASDGTAAPANPVRGAGAPAIKDESEARRVLMAVRRELMRRQSSH